MCINSERRSSSGWLARSPLVNGEGVKKMAMAQKLKAELEKKFGDFVCLDEPMSRHTSLSIGGPADAFARPVTMDQLVACVTWVKENNLPLTVIGHGTNLLVKDNGVRGMVITLKEIQSEIAIDHETEPHLFLTTGAGRSLHSVVSYAIDQGLKGLNFATGIPGTVGGGIFMNAGTNTGVMGDVIDSIRILTPEGRIERIFGKSLSFSYRKCDIRDDFGNTISDAVIVDAVFKLERGEKERLKKERELLASSRKKSQPMNQKSAGCFFKNPGSGKSAGELIDLSGLKGRQVGGARVSTLHANYFINEENATALDMIRLKDLVRQKVLEKFGVYLEEEVRIIGE